MRRLILASSAIVGVVLILLLLFVPVDERVVASGVVRSERDSYLYAPFDGLISSVPVYEGMSVKKGDPLMELDTTEYRDRLKQVEASIEKSREDLAFQQARLERTLKLPLPQEFWHMQEELDIIRERVLQAESERRRAAGLHAKGLMSLQDLERATLAMDLAKAEEAKLIEKSRIVEEGLESRILKEATAEIQAARASLKALEVDREIAASAIERCTIRSPEDGVVTYIKTRRPGTRVQPGDDLAHVSHGPGTRVDIYAGQNQYHRVAVGQRVLMRSNSFDTLRHGYIEGKVVRLAVEPRSDPPEGIPSTGTPLFRVVANVEKTPQDLVIGSTVEAKIIIRRAPLWRLLLPNPTDPDAKADEEARGPDEKNPPPPPD